MNFITTASKVSGGVLEDFKTKMEVNVTGCIDVYFTTDADTLKKYLETDNLLGIVVDSINEKVRQYREMLQELEKSLMNITSIPKKYFEV